MLWCSWITSQSGLKPLQFLTKKQKLLLSYSSSRSYVDMESLKNYYLIVGLIFSPGDLSTPKCEKKTHLDIILRLMDWWKIQYSTLINMIAKSCDVRDRDWDIYLPYLLFAYRVSAQESTREPPFFLMYGRDARIPTDSVLYHVRSSYAIDVEDYKEELLSGLTLAWKLARANIQKAQGTQKQNYDRKCTKDVNLKAGDRVMVFMPAESQGKNWKLSRQFHGLYRVLQVTPTNAEVRLIDRPKDEPIFVALDRIRLCYPE